MQKGHEEQLSAIELAVIQQDISETQRLLDLGHHIGNALALAKGNQSMSLFELILRYKKLNLISNLYIHWHPS